MGLSPGPPNLENTEEVKVVYQRPAVVDLADETIQSAAEIDDGGFREGIQVAPDLRHHAK